MDDSSHASVAKPPVTPLSTAKPADDTAEDNIVRAMSTSRLSPNLAPLKTSHVQNSPPHSSSPSPSSLSRRRSQSPLSLDLRKVPGLSMPAPPSNTLLITRLDDPSIFHPASLATIRQHINSIAPLNSFSPLKSMARLIVSFYDEASAIKVRQEVDGTAFSRTSVAKCYFGEPTPIGDEKKYLERPDAGRLFFISPPPSPPVGWEMKMEDPPNKQVHADDLAAKLSALSGKIASNPYDNTTSPGNDEQRYTSEELAERLGRSTTPPPKRRLASISENQNHNQSGSPPKMRSRSSTLIYDPKEHGDSPGLPAVMLETEDESDVELDTGNGGIMAHTARPPVELMD